jgi:hypothetical protein
MSKKHKEWNPDKPFLSPKRLFSAFRLWCFYVIAEDEKVRHGIATKNDGKPWYPLSFYLRWHRRKEARWRVKGY